MGCERCRVDLPNVPEPLGVSGLCAERALHVGAVLASIETEADCSSAEGRQRPVDIGGLRIIRYWSLGIRDLATYLALAGLAGVGIAASSGLPEVSASSLVVSVVSTLVTATASSVGASAASVVVVLTGPGPLGAKGVGRGEKLVGDLRLDQHRQGLRGSGMV